MFLAIAHRGGGWLLQSNMCYIKGTVHPEMKLPFFCKTQNEMLTLPVFCTMEGNIVPQKR